MRFLPHHPKFIHDLEQPGIKKTGSLKKVKAVYPTEDELVHLLINKDRTGYQKLYEMYSKSLYGVILRIVNHHEIAEDVLQETFMRISQHCNTYDASKGTFFTWIVNIARNLCIDNFRSKAFKKTLLTDSVDDCIDSINVNRSNFINTEIIGIKTLVNNMNPKYKKILDMIYFKGYTPKETAEILGISLGTLKTRLRKAILMLRKNI